MAWEIGAFFAAARQCQAKNSEAPEFNQLYVFVTLAEGKKRET